MPGSAVQYQFLPGSIIKDGVAPAAPEKTGVFKLFLRLSSLLTLPDAQVLQSACFLPSHASYGSQLQTGRYPGMQQ